jgi:hypothetical protein
VNVALTLPSASAVFVTANATFTMDATDPPVVVTSTIDPGTKPVHETVEVAPGAITAGPAVQATSAG